MKELNEKDFDTSYGFYFKGGYNELVESTGVSILTSEDIGDYQGTSYWLVEENGRIGYLSYGYGSCSGCDSLQACSTRQDVEDLRSDMHNSIHWEGSKEDMIQYLESFDLSKMYWSADEYKQVRDKFVSYLKS